MKGNNPPDHLVPLSRQALAIVGRARPLADGSGLIFPGGKYAAPLSETALRKELIALGFGEITTTHGFRSSFRDWAADTGKSDDLAEDTLAHRNKAADRALAGKIHNKTRPHMSAPRCSKRAGRSCRRGPTTLPGNPARFGGLLDEQT